MAIPGLVKTTTTHYKSVNTQLGSVIIHQGMIFLVTLESGLISGGKAYTKPIPAFKIQGVLCTHRTIDFEKDQVIDGRFFSWQEGGKYWLFIQPKKDPTSEPAGDPYAVLYYKYRG